MRNGKLQLAVAAVLASVQWSAIAGTCQAGPLTDILMGPNSRYQSISNVPLAQPPAAVPGGGAQPTIQFPTQQIPTQQIPVQSSGGGCCGIFGGARSSAGCCTPMNLQSTAGACCPTPVAPRTTTYRARWVRVPVTYYRPVTTTDPVTGCPVTCMRPCRTNAWQLRPARQGLFARLFNCGRNREVVVAASPVVSNGCCPTTPMITSTPITTMPGGVSPAPYYPSMTSPSQVGPAPATTVPGAAPTGPTPADQRPRLDPSGLPPANQGAATSNFAPLNAPQTAPLVREAPSTAQPQQPVQPLTTQAKSDNGLQAVPDANAPDREPPSNSAPELLDPNDRTAARPIFPKLAYSPISWPQPEAKTEPVVVSEPVSRAAATQPLWDDSGWQSANP